MINVHQRLVDAFDSLPLVQGFKPHYDWGDGHHLNQLIKLENNDNSTPYPLIYNVSPYSTQDSKKRIATYRVSLVIATQNKATDLLNSQRWATSYKNILFPLAGYIEQTFKKNQIFVWGGEFRLYEFPNYGQNGENETTDIWDALRFDTDITINDFPCINNFTYKTI
jgi:hypothetical protein